MRRTAKVWGALLTLPILLSACGDARAPGDLQVSVVGNGLRAPVDPNRGTATDAERSLMRATTMGLVGLDGLGQVEPALAESWITTADGTSTIFRLRRTNWPGGDEATGEEVAASLNRALAPPSRNALKPLLGSIDAVVGMTGRVVEIRLKVPRPNLLQLLAQPELGITRDRLGLGPYRVAQRTATRVRLVAIDDLDEGTPPLDPVMMRAERAARAVARFKQGDADLVEGGTLADLAIAQASAPRPGRLRFDPAAGLFGLAFAARGTIAEPAVRRALAMAIDRRALAATVGLPGWATRDQVLPTPLDSARPAARPDWSDAPIASRRVEAAQRIATWRATLRAMPLVRVALPPGPGMRTLFAGIAADWRAIGVGAVRVAIDAPDADLRLIDAVAPNASANWYLTTLSCAAGLVCDARGDTALIASRAAATLDARAIELADADAILAERAAFIVLGAPVRWSLVDPALVGWRENAFAVHPLHRLGETYAATR